MKKLLVLMLSIVLAAGLFTSCGGTDGEESSAQELSFGLAYEPETLDLANYTGDTSKRIIRLMTEPLLRQKDGEVIPGVAETYEVSDDGLTWTFHLRESTYSNGDPVTAEDFRYSILRTLNPENALQNAYLLYKVAGAEGYNTGTGKAEDVGVNVVDDYTLEITTSEITYPLAFTSMVFAPVQKAFVEEAGKSYGSEAEKTLGNGPFVVSSWTHDGEILLEKNTNYWNAEEIHMEQMTAKINAEGETAGDMMKAGELDFADFTDKKVVESILEDDSFTCESICTGYQLLNINHNGKTEETGKWLSNVNFKKALSCALDREALVASVYTADQAATRLTVPNELGSGEATFHEEFPYEAYSTQAEPEKAKEYLEKAMKELGAKDVSEIPEFTFLCNDSKNNMNCLNAIGDMWEKTLGIKTTIDAQPLTAMLDKAYSGDFDFWKGGKAIGLVDWADEELATDFISTAGNPINYQSEAYDKLWRKVCGAKDLKERKEYLFELEKYICENVLTLHVTWLQIQDVYRTNIKNLGYWSDGDYDLTYVEVE